MYFGIFSKELSGKGKYTPTHLHPPHLEKYQAKELLHLDYIFSILFYLDCERYKPCAK